MALGRRAAWVILAQMAVPTCQAGRRHFISRPGKLIPSLPRRTLGRGLVTRRCVLRFFGARGAIPAALLLLLLSASPPCWAEAPETPFAEVFAQLAARLVGVVVN